MSKPWRHYLLGRFNLGWFGSRFILFSLYYMATMSNTCNVIHEKSDIIVDSTMVHRGSFNVATEPLYLSVTWTVLCQRIDGILPPRY